ncbi:MAG: serine kinase [Spirosomataceae bacterium]
MTYSYQAFLHPIHSDIPLELPVANEQTGKQAIEIKAGEFDIYPGEATKIYRKGIQAYFHQGTSFYQLIWQGVGVFQIQFDGQITYQKTTDELAVFRLFLTSEVLGIALFCRSYFLLHGSAVQTKSGAHVFIGMPGAGKSTTVAAFAKAGFTVLTDDLIALSVSPHAHSTVLPAFPEIKIWEQASNGLHISTDQLTASFEGNKKYIWQQPNELFPQEPVPLQSITILRKPYSRNNRPLTRLEAPIELVKYFPLAHQLLINERLERHFQQSIQLAQTCPIHYMPRPLNFLDLEKFVQSFA